MNQTSYLALIQNAALLLAMALLFDLTFLRKQSSKFVLYGQVILV